MGGLEAATAIKTTTENRSTPIFCLTADDDCETVVAVKKCGMNGMLKKPFDIDEFRSAIEQYAKGTGHLTDPNSIVKYSRIKHKKYDGIPPAVRSKIVELWKKDTLMQIESAFALLNKLEWEKLSRIAHSMKGSSLEVGAKEVADIAAILQDQMKANADKNVATVEESLPIWEQLRKNFFDFCSTL